MRVPVCDTVPPTGAPALGGSPIRTLNVTGIRVTDPVSNAMGSVLFNVTALFDPIVRRLRYISVPEEASPGDVSTTKLDGRFAGFGGVRCASGLSN